VRSARVSTLGAEVVDAFYVTDRDGKPVTGATARAELVAALLGAARVGSTG
jgi:[protein-PII] uridylyltransferase